MAQGRVTLPPLRPLRDGRGSLELHSAIASTANWLRGSMSSGGSCASGTGYNSTGYNSEHDSPTAARTASRWSLGLGGQRNSRHSRFRWCATHESPIIQEKVVGDTSIRPELLRGVPVSKTLSWFGNLWQVAPEDLSNSGLERLWDMSRPCTSLDAFVSHAWMSPGWQRYLALLVHFYWRYAACAACLASILLVLLEIHGSLPIVMVDPRAVQVQPALRMVAVEHSPWGGIPPLLSLLTLFLAPAVLGGGRSEPHIFVDLVCINQMDESMKNDGVNSMAGFLSKSKTMIVLWTPHNLNRAWCIFELATFTALWGDRDIFWCPLFCYSSLIFVFLGTTLLVLGTDVLSCFELSHLSTPVVAALLAAPTVPLIVAFHAGRAFMRQKRQVLRDVDHFDVKKASCRKHEDQEFILSSVRHWYGSDAAFNNYVRGPLAKGIKREMAASDATYGNLLLAAFPAICFALQKVATLIRVKDLSAEEKGALCAELGGLFLLVYPAMLKLLWICMELFQWRHHYEVVDVGLSIVLVLAWDFLGHCILRAAIGQPLPQALAFLAASVLATWLLFSWSRLCSCCWYRRRVAPCLPEPTVEQVVHVVEVE